MYSSSPWWQFRTPSLQVIKERSAARISAVRYDTFRNEIERLLRKR